MTTTTSYDYGDAIRLAEKVSRFKEWFPALSQEQAFELAYDGIISTLLNGDSQDVSTKYLTGVARNTIKRHLAMRGTVIDVPANRTGAGFARFWLGSRGYTPDHAPDIIERLGIWQALDGLNDQQRGDLAAFAATLDVDTAAAQRGIAKSAYYKRLQRARATICAFWFAPDRAPTPRRVLNEGAREQTHAGRPPRAGSGVHFDRKHAKFVARGYNGKRRVYLGMRASKADAQELVDRYYRDRETGTVVLTAERQP